MYMDEVKVVFELKLKICLKSPRAAFLLLAEFL